MNIAYFEKSLVEHLGAAARGSFNVLGLSNTDIRQLTNAAGKMISLIAIENPQLFDTTQCTSVLTVEQANAKITEQFIPEYFVSNEAIFNASLNAKIADGTVNLDSLDENQSPSNQHHWLQQQGVKGIGVTQPPAPFAEAI